MTGRTPAVDRTNRAASQYTLLPKRDAPERHRHDALITASTPPSPPANRATLATEENTPMTPDQLYDLLLPFAGSIIGSVIAVGLALAVLIMRGTARVDADRRAFQAEAAADRRAFQAAVDADRHAFQTGMDDFRKEMQRLAERQSHVEGRFDATSAAGD